MLVPGLRLEKVAATAIMLALRIIRNYCFSYRKPATLATRNRGNGSGTYSFIINKNSIATLDLPIALVYAPGVVSSGR